MYQALDETYLVIDNLSSFKNNVCRKIQYQTCLRSHTRYMEVLQLSHMHGTMYLILLYKISHASV